MLFAGASAFFGGAAVVTIPAQLGTPVNAQVPRQSAPTPGAESAQASDRFEIIAQKVAPAVVAVESTTLAKGAPGTASKGRVLEESGSGVLIRVEGRSGYFVLTNNHVVASARPEQITINLADGRVFRPGRIWSDPESDVALLGIETTAALPTAPLGDSDRARVGQWVLAIGSPFGLNQTVTHGIVSARERGQVSLGNTIRIKDFLQTDAAINPGSSGGPLVDMRGEIIGINTAIASPSGSNSGVAFSIPVNLAKRVMAQLLERGSVARGYLGLQLTSSFEPSDALKLGLDRVRGARVERVYANTPAANAGIRSDDVILQVESIPIRDETHLINLISTLPAGQRVRLQIWRDRNTVAAEAVIGDWSKAQARFRAVP